MSGTVESGCKNREKHQLHICQLQKKGLQTEVAARCGNPGFICHNCNAEADNAEDLCNSSPLAKRG